MPENQLLLAHCLERPNDVEALLVYADWLEQEGDARAAYARAQLELKRAPVHERSERMATLRRLYPVDHPAWCGRFEARGVFEANLIGLDELWWGVGLGKRETMSTYQGFNFASQPPLPVERFNGSFDWLAAAPQVETQRQPDKQWPQRIAKLRQRGFSVPRAFETLMTSPALQARLPSCTANFFLRAESAEEHSLGPQECFLTFYSDQQSCVLWGLRLGSDGDVYAPVLGGVPEAPDEDPPEGEPYFRFPKLSFTAPTLESFVYRWWLENTIWFASKFKQTLRPLTAEEQAYLDHLSKA